MGTTVLRNITNIYTVHMAWTNLEPRLNPAEFLWANSSLDREYWIENAALHPFKACVLYKRS